MTIFRWHPVRHLKLLLAQFRIFPAAIRPSGRPSAAFRQSSRSVLEMHATSPSAPCPLCDQPSARLHSHYSRRLADLPWHGRSAELQVRVRRFRCATITCSRRIFAERLSAVALPKARRTTRLYDTQQRLALALGGAPGSRLAEDLAVTTVKRWATARRARGAGTPEVIAATTSGWWKAPSSRRCAKFLTTVPEKLDADERSFIEYLGRSAPGLIPGPPFR
jgi:hypothetical protein